MTTCFNVKNSHLLFQTDEFDSYAHEVRNDLNNTAHVSGARDVISSQNSQAFRAIQRNNSSASHQRNYPSRKDSSSSAACNLTHFYIIFIFNCDKLKLI
jgi:hypothetical protein